MNQRGDHTYSLLHPRGILRNKYHFPLGYLHLPATEKLGCLQKVNLSVSHIVHTLAYSVCQTISELCIGAVYCTNMLFSVGSSTCSSVRLWKRYGPSSTVRWGVSSLFPSTSEEWGRVRGSWASDSRPSFLAWLTEMPKGYLLSTGRLVEHGNEVEVEDWVLI